ncbi:copper chaperone PCu(A)C [Thiomicrospira pelophila]|uniref:copper chaperone PCu(A)C n=1 Tax=Thiomicrospira pelophila TaxID=934 RepID=UPI0004A6E974|nr:copper chaperone PCu(A)C [Thiomicrospira pelophila]
MFKRHTILAIALLSSLIGFNAMANQAADLEIENPFVREMPPTAPATGAFMTMINSSDQDIAIVSAKSDAAKTVELHTHTHDNGVMRMREIPKILVPAMGQAELKPGGLHIMLINPTRALKEGDEVRIVVTLKDGSEQEIIAPVRKIMGMGQHKGMGHGMKNM